MNFISNAIKYTDEGGTIRTSIRETETEGRVEVQFLVEDNGRGISAERQKDIFEPFKQGEVTDSSRSNGVGLGLPIVKNIVEIMGGSIEVNSEVGKGSRFTATLPLEVCRVFHEEAGNAAPEDLSGIHVLLAEDNELNAEIAVELLKSNKASVTLARDGEEAVRRFEQSPPGTYQAVLMDIRMPKMNGIEAAKAIRPYGWTSHSHYSNDGKCLWRTEGRNGTGGNERFSV